MYAGETVSTSSLRSGSHHIHDVFDSRGVSHAVTVGLAGHQYSSGYAYLVHSLKDSQDA